MNENKQQENNIDIYNGGGDETSHLAETVNVAPEQNSTPLGEQNNHKRNIILVALSLIILGGIVWSADRYAPFRGTQSVSNKTLLEIVQPDKNGVVQEDFLEIEAKISLLESDFNGDVVGSIIGFLKNKDTEELYTVQLSTFAHTNKGTATSVIAFRKDKEFSLFGKDASYVFSTLQKVKMVMHIPHNLENGKYELSLRFTSTGKYAQDPRVYVHAPPQDITITRTPPLRGDILSIAQTYPKSGVVPIVDGRKGNPVPVARFTLQGSDEDITLKAFEMGTEAGGKVVGLHIIGKFVDKFILVDADTKEYISDLIDMDTTSQIYTYNLFYLKNPMVIEAFRTRNVELQVQAKKNASSVDGVWATITNLYGMKADNTRVWNATTMRAEAFLDPRKEVTMDIVLPEQNAIIAGPILEVEWRMFFPSASLEDGEYPAFQVSLYSTEESSSGGHPRLLNTYYGISGDTGQPLFESEEHTKVTATLNIDEEEQGISGTIPIPNGTYDLIIRAAKWSKTKYGQVIYESVPFGNSFSTGKIITIQR